MSKGSTGVEVGQMRCACVSGGREGVCVSMNREKEIEVKRKIVTWIEEIEKHEEKKTREVKRKIVI